MASIANEITSPPWRRSLRRRLLNWFAKHRRDLPWRESRDPYRIWVSEIMLQQTQVATVEAYFKRFIEAFPTVAHLANAKQPEVLRLWEGLGYYRRARQMHRGAQVVVDEHDGTFPQDFDDVLALPGIGRYTAGAVLSIAFDQRQPILEANSIRLLARLVCYQDAPTSTAGQRLLWQTATEILPTKRVGDFNQALMELGSLVCTPREPACPACPLLSLCGAKTRNLVGEIPKPKKKTVYTNLQEVAVVIRRQGRVLLRQYSEEERWTGLWDFPRYEFAADETRDTNAAIRELIRNRTGWRIDVPKPLTTIKHGVTRYRITLHCHEAKCGKKSGKPSDPNPFQWVRIDQLEDVPLNVTGRKISVLIT